MSKEFTIVLRATSAAEIEALWQFARSRNDAPPVAGDAHTLRFELQPGLHETVGSLIAAIKWDDLAYNVAGSLIAAAILGLINSIYRGFSRGNVKIAVADSTQPAAAVIDVSEQEATFTITVNGTDAQLVARELRRELGHGAPSI